MLMKDKVTLITGASRGIGKAIAQACAAQGANVIGTATTEAGADKITQYLADAGTNGRGIVLNVADPDSIAQSLKQVKELAGAPEILINNAAIARDNLIMRMKEDEWQSVLDTNLTAAFRLCKAVVRPMLKARWGRIISISSIVACTGNPGQTNYSASKAGLIGFNRSFAQEIASRGITANVVAPGFTHTDMTDALDDEQQAELLTHIPMQRIASPDEIAHAVVFLASNMASYITGETLHVNGGMYMP